MNSDQSFMADTDLAHDADSATNSTEELGNLLGEYRVEIEANLQSALECGDTVPQQLLTKIDHIITLNKKDGIPTIRASAMLHSVIKAYKYGRSVSQDRFTLQEDSVKTLDDFDVAFKRFLSSRIIDEVERAREELGRCERLADEAVREAKADCDKLKERAEEEESLVTLDELEQIHAEADEMVVSDRQELTANRDRIRVMESVPGAETILLNTASEVETIFVISVTNCQELRGLQEDTSQWRGKLDTLWQQAEAALLIVETIGECVQIIMEDAKKKKIDWQQQLHTMKLKNLLQLRDSLMAAASIHLMGVNNCKASCKEKGDQVTSDHQQQHRQEQTCHEDKVKELQAELAAIDVQIQVLSPYLHLDTLEDRYENRMIGVRLACDQKDINAVEIRSHGNYSEQRRSRRCKATGEQRMEPRREGRKQQRRETGRGRRRMAEADESSSTRKLHPKRSSQTVPVKKGRSLERPHQCTYCQKRFARQDDLQTHILTHTGHQCTHCNKIFARRGALQRHLLTHTGEKPHQCDRCPKKFAQLGHLYKHMLTHTGEKPHQCEVCQKRFNRRSNLQRHVITHTGVKPHQCDYCQKRFARIGDLKPHLLTHTGEKPFQCAFCQKRFNRSGNLQRHVHACHSGKKQDRLSEAVESSLITT